ncbi:MAG: type III pantothenate kinase [Angelakisella sp.]|nr:type III pantothenate kinase [Angelakisella sp.]
MLLAVDIGNTNIKFGIFCDEKLMHSIRLGTRHDITSDEIGLSLIQFFQFFNIQKESIEDVVITSVVPQVMHSMANAIRKYIEKEPLIVGDTLPVTIPNRYGNPGEVGMDRLVDAVGAYERYGGPLVIVDFGTATTFNAVDRDGGYLGGAIMPGIQISMKALFERTAKLPRIELTQPRSVIGKNTVQSMQSGAFYGYSGAVMNIANLMKQELGEDTKLIVTGGLSSLFAKGVAGIDHVDTSITLSGLLALYRRYKQNEKN